MHQPFHLLTSDESWKRSCFLNSKCFCFGVNI